MRNSFVGPTPAGTGSEVGRSTVVIIPSLGRKVVFGGPALLPRLAILDPELTVGLPPALTAATVGIAFGHGGDIPAEASGAVILESSLQKVDELLHIARRLRNIALQSALGGMALSVIGMLVAAAGYLPPVAGAITQEVIDVVVVVNALRVAIPPKTLTDY